MNVESHNEIAASEAALRRSDERYRAFIRNSSEAIWCFELDEPVSVALPAAEQIEAFYRLSFLAECNEAMARMYGYSRPDELVGLRLDQLMPRSDPKNVRYLEAFIAAGHQLHDAESVEMTRDGTRKYLLNSLCAVVEQDFVLRAWGTSRDVTVWREAEDARQRYIVKIERLNETLEQRVAERTAELAEANDHLRSFAHTIAHDLRAPLRSMQGFSGILLSDFAEQLPPDAADLARRINRSAARMDALVASVLDYSRTLSAQLTIEAVAVDEVVADILERFADSVQEKQAAILVAKNLPAVQAHRGLLTQALENLITNALKFVPPGAAPQVEIGARAGAGRAQIYVRDQGIGIANVNREKLFGIFQRMHPQGEYPGTGVGLAIVHAAVTRMGGDVGFHSEPGRGSEFWLELPQASAPPST